MSTREDDVVAGLTGRKERWSAFVDRTKPMLKLGELVSEVIALNEAIKTLKDKLPSAVQTHSCADLKRFLLKDHPELGKSAEISSGIDAKEWSLFLSILLPQVVGVKSSAFGSPAEAVDFFSTIPLILSRSHNIARLKAGDTEGAIEDKLIADALKDVVKSCSRLIVIAQDYLNKRLVREAGVDGIDAAVKSPQHYILDSIEAFRRIQGLGSNVEGILSAASYRFVAVPALTNVQRHIVTPYAPRSLSNMMGRLVIPAHQWASIAGGSAHAALGAWQGFQLANLVQKYPEAVSIFSDPAQTISHLSDKILALMPPSMPWPEDSLTHRKALYHLLNDELLGKRSKDSILESALKNLFYNLSLESIHKVSREISPKLVKILASLLVLNRLEDGVTFLGANAAFDLLLSQIFAAPLVMTAQMFARPALSGKIDSAIVRETLRFEIRKLLVAYLFNPEELLFFEALTPPSLTAEEKKQVKHFIKEINDNLSHAQTLYEHRASVAPALELTEKTFTYLKERFWSQEKPAEEKTVEASKKTSPRKNQVPAPAFIRTPYTAYKAADSALKQALFGSHAGIYPTGSDSNASQPIGRFVDKTLAMVPYASVRQVPSPWEARLGYATVIVGVTGLGYGSYAIGQRVAGAIGGYVGIGVYSAAGVATATYFGIFESQAQKLSRQISAAKATYQLPSEAEINQAERDLSKSFYACCFRPTNLTGSRRARFAELEEKAKSALDAARGLAREAVTAQNGIHAAKTEKALRDLNIAPLVKRMQALIKKDADYPEVAQATRLLIPICYQLEQNFKKHEKTRIDDYGYKAFEVLFSTLSEMDSEKTKDGITAFWPQKIEDPRLKEDYPTLHPELTTLLRSLKTSWAHQDETLLNWLEKRRVLFQDYSAFKEAFNTLIIEHAYNQAWLRTQLEACQHFKEELTKEELKDSRLTQGFDRQLTRDVECVQKRIVQHMNMVEAFKQEVSAVIGALREIQNAEGIAQLPDSDQISGITRDFEAFLEPHRTNEGKQGCIRDVLGSPPAAATGAAAAAAAAPRRARAEDSEAIYLEKIKQALVSQLSAFKDALLRSVDEQIGANTASLKSITAVSEAFEAEVAAYATKVDGSVVSEAVTGHIRSLKSGLPDEIKALHECYDATDEIRGIYEPVKSQITKIDKTSSPTVVECAVTSELPLPTRKLLTSNTKTTVERLTPFAEYHGDELKAVLGMDDIVSTENIQRMITLKIQTALIDALTRFLKTGSLYDVQYERYISSLEDTSWQRPLQDLYWGKKIERSVDAALKKLKDAKSITGILESSRTLSTLKPPSHTHDLLERKRDELNKAIEEKLREHDPSAEFRAVLRPIQALVETIKSAEYLPSVAIVGATLPKIDRIQNAFMTLDKRVSDEFSRVDSAQYQAVLKAEFGMDEACGSGKEKATRNVARLKTHIRDALYGKLKELIQAKLAVLISKRNSKALEELKDAKNWEQPYRTSSKDLFGADFDTSFIDTALAGEEELRSSIIPEEAKKDIADFFSKLEACINPSKGWGGSFFTPPEPLTKAKYDEAITDKQKGLGPIAKHHFNRAKASFEASHPKFSETPAAESTPAAAAAAAASSRG